MTPTRAAESIRSRVPGRGYEPTQGYAQPGYGQPPKKNNTNLIIAGIVAAVVLIAGGIITFVLLNKDDSVTPVASSAASTDSDGGQSQTTSSESVATTEETADTGGGGGGSGDVPDPTSPEGLGDDPTMDALAQDCFDGNMEACDQLFFVSEVGSAYEDYGYSCGGRVPEGETVGLCVTAYP